MTLYVFLDRYVPEVGGRLVEPMDDNRLRRFLAARRHNIEDAAALFAAHWKFRAKTFGPRARAPGRAPNAFETRFVCAADRARVFLTTPSRAGRGAAAGAGRRRRRNSRPSRRGPPPRRRRGGLFRGRVDGDAVFLTIPSRAGGSPRGAARIIPRPAFPRFGERYETRGAVSRAGSRHGRICRSSKCSETAPETRRAGPGSF